MRIYDRVSARDPERKVTALALWTSRRSKRGVFRLVLRNATCNQIQSISQVRSKAALTVHRLLFLQAEPPHPPQI